MTDFELSTEALKAILNDALTNNELSSGVFAKITGVGIQSQTLDMGGNLLDNATALVSNAANPATAGVVRLGNTESIEWLNFAGSANLGIFVDASDQLVIDAVFAGVVFTQHPNLVTGDPANDTLLIHDATDGLIKEIIPNDLGLAGAGTHNLLSTTHPDTLAAAVSRGSLIVGNLTPLWSELVIGGANTVLHSDGTDATWATLAKADLPGTTVYTDQANTFGAFDQRFPTTRLQLDNPAQTFQYIFATSAIITVDKTVTLPLLTANDTFVFEAFGATLTNKTITLGANTITGTAAQFDTAVTDDNFAFVSDNLSVFAATTSAQLAGVISDETGTSLLVFNDTPTLLTPTIADLTNATHSHLNAAGGGTITMPALTGTKAEFDTALSDDDFAYIGQANVFTQTQNLNGNTLDNVGILQSNATNLSSVGAYRLGNAEIIGWRNVGNTNDITLTVNASDDFDFSIDGSLKLRIGGSLFDYFGNSIDNINFINTNATNPAGQGVFRLGNLEEIVWRNAANTNDIEFFVNASDRYVWQIDNLTELVLDKTFLDLQGNNLNNVGDLEINDAKNIILNTTTGTKIGTATNQKLAFYNSTPVVQQTGVAVTAAGVHAALVTLGLITA